MPHDHVLNTYYICHCFPISEQNIPSCMLWYQAVKQVSLLGILKYRYWNLFHEMCFTQKYTPENTLSKCAYALNTRQSWLRFSKPHLQDCCQVWYMINLNNLKLIRNNLS